MYSDNKYVGDHVSVAEELLAEIPELEQKCRAVDKAVGEGYFNLERALSVYNVSEIEYLPYLLLKYNVDLKRSGKQEQVFETFSTILDIYFSSIPNFDQLGKSTMAELKRLTESVSAGKNLLKKSA